MFGLVEMLGEVLWGAGKHLQSIFYLLFLLLEGLVGC